MTLLVWLFLTPGFLFGTGCAQTAWSQRSPSDTLRLDTEAARLEGVERVRRRIDEISRTTSRRLRHSAVQSPPNAGPQRNDRQVWPPRQRAALTHEDLPRLQRRLRQIIKALLAEELPLYWENDVVYLPLRTPTRRSSGEGAANDVQDTVYTGDAVRIAQDTIRLSADTVRNADSSGAVGEPIRERRIETVESRLLDEGVYRAFEVNFAFGSSTLQPRAARTLDVVGQVLERHPNPRIEVAGHTDAVGTEAFNKTLSEARAEVVRKYLLTHFDLDPNRLIARGYGEARPVRSNDTPAGRALNRRVEFTLLNSTSAAGTRP